MIPTEAEEQIKFVQWLRLKNLPHFRVPNETYTKSWRQKNMNKALGVSKGVPDIFIIVAGKLVAVEMKRIKGGVTSTHQMKWINILNNANVPTVVAKGHKEAIKFIKDQRNV